MTLEKYNQLYFAENDRIYKQFNYDNFNQDLRNVFPWKVLICGTNEMMPSSIFVTDTPIQNKVTKNMPCVSSLYAKLL